MQQRRGVQLLRRAPISLLLGLKGGEGAGTDTKPTGLHQGLHAHLRAWSKAFPKGCLVGGFGASPIVQWTGRAETRPRVEPQGPPLGAAKEDQSLRNTVFKE